jgi:DNA-binding Lrp family transcriptional regulator
VPRSPDAAGEGRDSRQHPEHQDDGGPGTGCQPSSAAGDGQTDASPAAPDDFTGLTSNERKVLRAILALQTDGAFVTYRTIAERSGVQQDALSYYTKSLEQKGWLRRDGPVSDRRYHVLRNPDGGSTNHSVAQHAWNGHAHSERDHDQAKARSRDSDEAVCSACKRRAASEGDLCTSCAGMVTTCPGVGDGALPHYDDRVRASMAKDVKQRKSRKSRAGV